MNRWCEDLERELRESPVPDHGPDHFARIRARLAECEATAEPDRPRARPGAARARTRRGPAAKLGAFAALAAALVVALAVAWTTLPGLERAEPAEATARTVLRHIQTAMAGLDSISGDIVEYGEARDRPFARKVGTFVFTSEGDCRLEHTTRGLVCTYDARSGVAWRVKRQGGEIVASERATGLPDPGPFLSPWSGIPLVLDRSAAAYARAVIAELDPDVPVTPIVYEGRTAWRIDVAERLVGGGTNGSVGIVVDAVSGYPLLVEHWSEDGDVSGTRCRHLRVNAPTTRELFTVEADAATRYVRLSERHRQLTLPEAAALGERLTREARGGPSRRKEPAAPRFTPYLPRWTPAGYRLDGVTGAVNGAVMGRYTEAIRDGETGSLTVVLTYRRGFDRFSVISTWRRVDPPGLDDPFLQSTAASPFVRSAVIERGALRGSSAHVVMGLAEWPHVYTTAGSDRHLSVCVAGDLTRDELLRVTSSLRPIGIRQPPAPVGRPARLPNGRPSSCATPPGSMGSDEGGRSCERSACTSSAVPRS